jgi:hypothetical protein
MPVRSSDRSSAAIAVAAVIVGTAIAVLLWRGLRHDSYWLWAVEQDDSSIVDHALDAGSVAIQTGRSPARVQVLDLNTGKNRRASFEGAILADSPAGQPAVLLELDATKRLHAIETLLAPPRRVAVEPPCPPINARWFASAGSVVGVGYEQIAHVTPDGHCRVSQVRGTTLNLWLAGIESTGLVYVASTSDEGLYTLRPEDGELRSQPGIAAEEVLASPALPGALVADKESIALFIGTREVWRTREFKNAGPRTMARSEHFVAVLADKAGGREFGVMRASDGSVLERVPLLNGGAFALAGRCLLLQDLQRSEWVTFRGLGTAAYGMLARTRLSPVDGNIGRVAGDIVFLNGVVLVGSGHQVDAYRLPDECL